MENFTDSLLRESIEQLEKSKDLVRELLSRLDRREKMIFALQELVCHQESWLAHYRGGCKDVKKIAKDFGFDCYDKEKK
jgi:hypothetical protein